MDYTEWERMRQIARNRAAAGMPPAPSLRVPLSAESAASPAAQGVPQPNPLMDKVKAATGGGKAASAKAAMRVGPLRSALNTFGQAYAAPLAAVELTQQAQRNVNAIEQQLRGDGAPTGNPFVDLGADVGRTLAGKSAQTPTGRWAEGLGTAFAQYQADNRPSSMRTALANAMSPGPDDVRVPVYPIGTAGSPGNAQAWQEDFANREFGTEWNRRAKEYNIRPAGAQSDRVSISAGQAAQPSGPDPQLQAAAATEGWSPEAKARFNASMANGAYDRSKYPSEEQSKQILATRLAGYDRAFNDIRDTRAMQAGIPRELLDMNNGDLGKAREMEQGYRAAKLMQLSREPGPTEAGLRAAMIAAKAGKGEEAGEGVFSPGVLGYASNLFKDPKAAALFGHIAGMPNADKMNPQQLTAGVDLYNRFDELGIPMRPADVAKVKQHEGFDWSSPWSSWSMPWNNKRRRYTFEDSTGYEYDTPYAEIGDPEEYRRAQLYRRFKPE